MNVSLSMVKHKQQIQQNTEALEDETAVIQEENRI
jgi:hypothetical protein